MIFGEKEKTDKSAKELDILYKKASELRNNGKYADTIKIYEQILKINPDDILTWINKARVYNLQEMYPESIEAFEHAIRIKPHDFDAWLGKGSSLKDNKQYEEAVVAFDKAITIKPKEFAPWWGKAESLYNLSKFNEAIEAYDNARNIKRDFIYPYMLNRMNSLTQLGRYEEALQGYEEMLKISPDNAEAQEGLDAIKKQIKVETEVQNKKEINNGLVEEQCVIKEKEFENPDIEIQKIQSALKKWYRQNAINWWQTNTREFAMCDDGNEKIISGEGYLRPGHLVCEKCIDKYFTYTIWNEAKYDLSGWFGPNVPDHIIKLQLEKKKNATSSSPHFNENGIINQSQECSDEMVVESEKWLKKAQDMYDMGSFNWAMEPCEEAIKINPNNIDAWILLACLLNGTNNNEALIACERAITLNPQRSEIWSIKSMILYNSHRYEEALKSEEQAIKIDPSNVNAWYGKGGAYKMLGKNREAIEALDVALKLDPKREDIVSEKERILKKMSPSEEAE